MAHKAEEGNTSVYILGGAHSAVTFKFKLLGHTPSLETWCAR